jgi:ABC-type antimicrobial peptide transport system permease subunit
MLRALGMRPRNSGAIVFVQAGTIALVGLVVGLPLGLVSGRTVWRSVALDTPIEFVVPRDWSAVGLVALAVVGTAALLAVWPSKRLATLQLSRELRSE